MLKNVCLLNNSQKEKRNETFTIASTCPQTALLYITTGLNKNNDGARSTPRFLLNLFKKRNMSIPMRQSDIIEGKRNMKLITGPFNNAFTFSEYGITRSNIFDN